MSINSFNSRNVLLYKKLLNTFFFSEVASKSCQFSYNKSIGI